MKLHKSAPIMKLLAAGEKNPLVLAFVSDAVAKLADAILKDEAASLKALENSLVYGPAWIAAAKESLKAIDA